jgi:hypothetical protein
MKYIKKYLSRLRTLRNIAINNPLVGDGGGVA